MCYIDALRQVLTEVVRVLRPDGTVWLHLGDVHSGRANAGSSVDRHTGRGHRGGVVAKARVSTTRNASPLFEERAKLRRRGSGVPRLRILTATRGGFHKRRRRTPAPAPRGEAVR